MGWSDKKTLAELGKLSELGKIKCVKVPRPNIAGAISMVYAYQVIKEPKTDE